MKVLGSQGSYHYFQRGRPYPIGQWDPAGVRWIRQFEINLLGENFQLYLGSGFNFFLKPRTLGK